jgi:hypothetical protein
MINKILVICVAPEVLANSMKIGGLNLSDFITYFWDITLNENQET